MHHCYRFGGYQSARGPRVKHSPLIIRKLIVHGPPGNPRDDIGCVHWFFLHVYSMFYTLLETKNNEKAQRKNKGPDGLTSSTE